jgi:3-hydroxyisobutyrate dehydrogenase-like beta-hydroxyacid dehydrogenase
MRKFVDHVTMINERSNAPMGEHMEVGLIGLGRMGTGIAKSLLRAGHRVTVYNRTPARAIALRGDGAIVATSIAEVCNGDAVLTMLADDSAVESVVFGVGGVLKSLPHGHAHISLSTISVALSDRLATEHASAGQDYLAAPVFGRPESAEGGKLAIVAAGQKATIDRFRPVWDAMGPKVFVLGERPSMANVAKLAGNFLIATVMESLGEALAFARKSGLDPAALLDLLTSTLFNAPVYKTYGALIAEGKHDHVGFALPLGLKDVKLVLQAAEAQGVPMPIASVLRDRFLTAIARGYEQSDWSVIGRLAAEDAGLHRAKHA